MALMISSELHGRLLAAAAASPDAEICGLLIGHDAIEQMVPAANVAADPSRSFEIDPAVLFGALRNERAGRGRLIGYYHSHPNGPPTPSRRDEDQAVADGRVWIVIGAGQATAWTLGSRNKFNAIELQITA